MAAAYHNFLALLILMSFVSEGHDCLIRGNVYCLGLCEARSNEILYAHNRAAAYVPDGVV